MIESITIESIPAFGAAAQTLGIFKTINFVYGGNGVGKTTLSRIIGDCVSHDDCSLQWKENLSLEICVYNRDFIHRHFQELSDLPGIFTLGENNADIVKKIEVANADLSKLKGQLVTLQNSLESPDRSSGQRVDLAVLKDHLKDTCWIQKTKYDDQFKDAFEGVRGSQDRFRDKVLLEDSQNTAELHTLVELTEKAQTLLGKAPVTVVSLAMPSVTALVQLEFDPILPKKVLGKSDIDIAALIKRLGNSDWVKTGRAYLTASDGACPFCQQDVPDGLQQNLAGYFDEAFEQDTRYVAELERRYKTESSVVQDRLAALIADPRGDLDSDRLAVEVELFEKTVQVNLQRILSKVKEPSQSISLDSLSEIVDRISLLIGTANEKIAKHNRLVSNFASEKEMLCQEVWRYIIDEELRPYLDAFKAKADALSRAIAALESKVEAQEEVIDQKKKDIRALEKQVTSIQPTVDAINGLLKSFGFSNFVLATADETYCYKLLRSDGSDAKNTLSEGERSFVTFLYFYHLLKGSTSETGTTLDRVVVFDDPVSSLDSDVLFIVGALIKGLIGDARARSGPIKQLFVLTHNVYFHKEVTYDRKRPPNGCRGDETFWMIAKSGGLSVVQSHANNPVKTSYELLWAQVRAPSTDSGTVQNVLRRILENYFKILGNIDLDQLCGHFEGKDKQVCKSLISWVHDGSHYAYDDLYISMDSAMLDTYLRVFKEVFERSGHLDHYKMMMGDYYAEATEQVPQTAA